MRRAVFPGTFDPLTVAHVAIADAVRTVCDVDRVELVLSTAPLAKEPTRSLDNRVAAIERVAANRLWLAVRTTDSRLIADIATGYDILVLGADKWAQILDVSYYGGSPAARDAAVASLPKLAVVPRRGIAMPDRPGTTALDGLGLDDISSTAVREGRIDWLA